MITKGERRDERRRKTKAHKEDGRSVRLLWNLAMNKAREAAERVRLRKS